MRFGIPALVAAVMVAQSAMADDREDAKLVRQFCFVLQAQALCDDLIVNMQTEKRIEEAIGFQVRGPEAPFNDSCWEGLNEASDRENEAGFCEAVWRDFGCFGSIRPALIMQSPFGNPDAVTCKFVP
ncbi:MAG: hypothetical protein M9955_20185 [Rhizobiaceae bacterium]|nr:hypothetical protein [Rhizobiaceae bacterium]